MKGIRICYGCCLTRSATPLSSEWKWQSHADFETWWNSQFMAHAGFPLLLGGVETTYLALVIAVGELDEHDRHDTPCVIALGKEVILPLDHLSSDLRSRIPATTLNVAERVWERVVEMARSRGIILEQQAHLLFIYEQDLCEDP